MRCLILNLSFDAEMRHHAIEHQRLSVVASAGEEEGLASRASVRIDAAMCSGRVGEKVSASAVATFNREAARADFSEESQAPNKAPEPTSRSVTPRAIVPKIEVKLRIQNRPVARVAPARAVAHL